MADRYEIRLPALRIRQGQQYIYIFGVDGKRSTTSPRSVPGPPRRHANSSGYQRPEVLSHIKAIRRYLESDGAMLPNAIVLAFDERVDFEAATIAISDVDYVAAGELVIPSMRSLPDDEKPAWLVDGQQRSAAIRDADLAEFAVAAVGFIAHGEDGAALAVHPGEQHQAAAQGPDPRTAAGHRGAPPAGLRQEAVAGAGLDATQLRSHDRQPFAGRIATPTMPDGYIKDNSVLKMIENSLYDGALYQYRDPEDGAGDVEQMLLHLNYFWTVVQVTFPEAWDLPPTKSRLTHGAGIQALGYVMDALTDGTTAPELPKLGIERKIEALAEHCAWT